MMILLSALIFLDLLPMGIQVAVMSFLAKAMKTELYGKEALKIGGVGAGLMAVVFLLVTIFKGSSGLAGFLFIWPPVVAIVGAVAQVVFAGYVLKKPWGKMAGIVALATIPMIVVLVPLMMMSALMTIAG